MSDSIQPRVFLVVVDETEEYRIAVHYAARRAAHTGGRVALLYVIEPAEMQQWMWGILLILLLSLTLNLIPQFHRKKYSDLFWQ